MDESFIRNVETDSERQFFQLGKVLQVSQEFVVNILGSDAN
jgi:hypothetical protein